MPWLDWFLACLLRAVQGADGLLAGVLIKTQFWQRWAGTPMNARQTLVLNRVLDRVPDGMEGITNAKWAAIGQCSADLDNDAGVLQPAAGAALFSATLAPMDFVAHMLGLPPDTLRVDVPSPFAPEQCGHSRAAWSSPSATPLWPASPRAARALVLPCWAARLAKALTCPADASLAPSLPRMRRNSARCARLVV
jgi:hypothetical protein